MITAFLTLFMPLNNLEARPVRASFVLLRQIPAMCLQAFAPARGRESLRDKEILNLKR